MRPVLTLMLLFGLIGCGTRQPPQPEQSPVVDTPPGPAGLESVPVQSPASAQQPDPVITDTPVTPELQVLLDRAGANGIGSSEALNAIGELGPVGAAAVPSLCVILCEQRPGIHRCLR